MILVDNVEVFNFEGAIRGMRNPMNSWDKSDSEYKVVHVDEFSFEETKDFVIGPNDLSLMRRLYKAGTEHRKYLRQIFVSMDITAPLYWWKEFSTYKFVDPDLLHIDTNSCSTMHKIAAKEFELDDFSCEHLIDFHGKGEFSTMGVILNDLNWSREKYLETKNKNYWWQMIQLLPSSYNQKRTVTFSYETVVSMIKQRTGHKLDEWNEFVKILNDLPYIKEITEKGE